MTKNKEPMSDEIETVELPDRAFANALMKQPGVAATLSLEQIIGMAIKIETLSAELETAYEEINRIQSLKYGPKGQKPIEIASK